MDAKQLLQMVTDNVFNIDGSALSNKIIESVFENRPLDFFDFPKTTVSIYDEDSDNRIEVPMRGKKCLHLQCFDGEYHIAKNIANMCPNCKQCDYPKCDDRDMRKYFEDKYVYCKYPPHQALAKLAADIGITKDQLATYTDGKLRAPPAINVADTNDAATVSSSEPSDENETPGDVVKALEVWPKFCNNCYQVRCPICQKEANIHEIYVDERFKKWLSFMPRRMEFFWITNKPDARPKFDRMRKFLPLIRLSPDGNDTLFKEKLEK